MWHYLITPFLLFASLFQSPQTAYTKMVDRVQSSVVRITGEQALDTWVGPQQVPYVCSGVVIAVNRILTAAHCRGEHILADGTPATVLAFNEFYDLALLVAVTDKPSITLRDVPVQRFEDLTAVGYAWGWNRLTVLRGPAFLVNMAPASTHAPGLLVQASYIGGMSGGAVVDVRGHMVGIVQQSNEGVGYGVSTQIIRVFLLGL